VDIIDTQVHFNQIGTLDAGIAAMAAVGISGVMFDEWSHFDEHKRLQPGELLANGEFRPLCPLAEAAATAYPEKFGVLRRVGPRDPQLAKLASSLAAARYCAALRLLADTQETAKALADGELDHVFATAADHDLPLFVLTNGHAELLRRPAERFPDLSIVVDHCGLVLEKAGSGEPLKAVFELARHPNVILKWSHATYFLTRGPYPFEDVIPWLRQAISHYGESRIMWGSDFTIVAPFASWAEELFHIRDAAGLSQTEKDWILGKTARAVLGWSS
jgi:L-fuconolactonase